MVPPCPLHQPRRLQTIRTKPLEYAGELKIKYDLSQPLSVVEIWLLVKLLTRHRQTQAKGWIRRWKDNKLLISFSLLYKRAIPSQILI